MRHGGDGTRRVAFVALAVTLVAPSFVGMAARSAGAAAGGSISGIVTADAGGAPVAGICVSAHKTDIDSTQLTSTTTAANGRYTLANVPAGIVNVQFSDTGLCKNGHHGNLVGEWYKNQLSLTTAQPVTVANGANRPNINASLAAGGAISGVVNAAPSGVHLRHICVGAFLPGVVPRIVAIASTASNGTYTLTGVPGGSVLVEFFASGFCPGGAADNYVGQWFNGRTTPGGADVLSVTAGTTIHGVDAGLLSGGTISGVVASSGAHGSHLFGICVEAFAAGSGSTPVVSTATLQNGRYTLRGVPTGDVRVQFNSQGECPGGIVQHFVTQWYSHKTSFATSNGVTVVAGRNRANINAGLVSLVPTAPKNVHATKPSRRTVIVTWGPPATSGGAPIAGYDVTFGGKTLRLPASARQATFAGLANGTYHFRARARNALGLGPFSTPSNAVHIA